MYNVVVIDGCKMMVKVHGLTLTKAIDKVLKLRKKGINAQYMRMKVIL